VNQLRAKIRATIVALLFAFPAAGYSASIAVFHAEHNWGVAGWVYDPITQTLQTNTQWSGRWMSVFPEEDPTSSIFAEDITAYYFVSAQVDHSGTVLGGTYSFLASSPTLGLYGIQPIITGSILGSTRTGNHELYDNHLLASVDFYNPLLAQITAFPNTALLTVHTCFCVEGSFNRWETNFSFGTVQPDIIVTRQVAEPSSAMLSMIGMIGLVGGLVTFRRRPAASGTIARRHASRPTSK
jgi:hypothetical protein